MTDDNAPSLEDRIDAMTQAGLQAWFESQIGPNSRLPLPPKVLVMSDFHAADGDRYDPLKKSGMEPWLLDVLSSHLASGYALFASEIWDMWRGYTLEDCAKAHPDLDQIISAYIGRDLLYWVDSNHSKDVLTLPECYVFEGYGRKVFLDHWNKFDWPNCWGWKIGRKMVRLADELGVVASTSPILANVDRHGFVKRMRHTLADINAEWDFFGGHLHLFEDVGNYHNDGSPITGVMSYFRIEEGVISSYSSTSSR
jgi:hypothetical protein